MDISSSLLVKGAAGALAATAAVGTGVAAKEGLIGGFFGINAEPEEEKAEGREDSRVNPNSASDGVPNGSETANAGDRNEQGQQQIVNTVGGNPDSNGVGLSDAGDATGAARESLTLGNDPATVSSVNNADENSHGSGATIGDAFETTQGQTQDSNVRGGGEGKQKPNPTKWDSALINYLKDKSKNDRDITFTVKTGKDGNEALTDSFPSFENEGGKGKSGNKQKSTVTVTVTTSNANLIGTDSDDEIKKLKAMNGDKDWTWECKVIFSREKDDSGLDFEDKEKIIGNEGFFNKLVANNNKELKIKFIRNCAESRDNNKSAEYESKQTLGDEKITSEKIFKLEKGDNASKLKIKGGGFDVWFSEPSKTKQQPSTDS